MSEPVAWMVDCDGKCDLEPIVETDRPETMDRYECGVCGRGPEQMTVTPLYRAPEPDDPEGLVEAAFREGFAAGYESGMDDAHYDSPAGEGVENAWAESDALRALRDRLQAQEAGDATD